ncbi:MAG TPA: response regulator, partial [bacterium]|nr:response regulator [bacterium]
RVHTEVPAAVLGDPSRVRQVLFNLLGNALKFTEHGEVVLEVTPEADGLRFEVRDTGIGIPADVLPNLFQSFVQADGSTARKYGGTGLGLAICKELVELMGGAIGATSTLGEGSTFWCTLPLPARSEAPACPAAPDGLFGQPVLVAEDNPTARKVLVDLLTTWGAKPVVADGADAVLELLLQIEDGLMPLPALAILDFTLPEFDGAALARAIRANSDTARLPLVLLTRPGQPALVRECQRQGLAICTPKPVRQAALLRAIRAALQPAPEPPALAGISVRPVPQLARVLVAEDHPVNQRVTLHLLRRLKMEGTAVNNGREALDALKRGRFDLVLMDCQMPEMDGFTAATAIRALEGDLRSIPIVAMTAMALPGDRERCLAAGMDDYLQKPVDLERLADVLQRWLPEKFAAGEPAPTPPHPDPDWLRYLRELETQAPGMLPEVVAPFLSETRLTLERLESAVRDGDPAAVESHAHRLKGSSANLGMAQLAHLCGQL